METKKDIGRQALVELARYVRERHRAINVALVESNEAKRVRPGNGEISYEDIINYAAKYYARDQVEVDMAIAELEACK